MGEHLFEITKIYYMVLEFTSDDYERYAPSGRCEIAIDKNCFDIINRWTAIKEISYKDDNEWYQNQWNTVYKTFNELAEAYIGETRHAGGLTNLWECKGVKSKETRIMKSQK